MLIQSRPEQAVADGEYGAFLHYGNFAPEELHRIHIERGEMPAIDLAGWAGIIVGGGPANFAADDADKSPEQLAFEPWLFELSARAAAADHPFLGACLGLGSLVHGLGGRMSFDVHEPVAPVRVLLTEEGGDDPLLADFPASFMAFAGHKEGISDAPSPIRVLARSANAVHLVRVGRNVYATQFHPELDADGLEQRIRAYNGYGYFRADEVESLVEAGHEVEATWPMRFLRRFVELARQHSAAR